MNTRSWKRLQPTIALLLLGTPGAIAVDIDDDAIDDALESSLIQQYRPHLYFDRLESVFPAAVEWYIQHCELVLDDEVILTREQLSADPALLLTAKRGNQSSSMEDMPEGSSFRPRPDRVGQLGQAGAHVGMYGHVVRLSGPLIYLKREDRPIGQRGDILVQYWQFFGFNESKVDSCCDFFCPEFLCHPYDHDGDWLYLDVVVTGTPPYSLKNVVYHHHGDNTCAVAILPDEAPLPKDGVPRCYLEYDVHEWWHGPNVSDCFGGQAHRGDGLNYRSESVENLGERFAPMSGLAARLVMGFNGQWGMFGGPGATPADSPLFQRPPGYVSSLLWVAYVNAKSTSWDRAGLGSAKHPFRSVSRAVAAIARTDPGRFPGEPRESIMRISPGSYPDAVTIDFPLSIETDGHGIVTIGQ